MTTAQVFKRARTKFMDQSGISLVVVLWVVALLMIIATEFVYAVRVDSMSAGNFRDEASAQALAFAGINMGAAGIAAPYKIAALNGEGKVIFIDPEKNETRTIGRAFELGEGRVEYVIEDESGKLNLNTASREILADLFKNSGVEGSSLDTIVDSILDWRDENHEHHLNGAEDDYYGHLPRPYGAKDGPFDMIDEIMMVKGMSPAIFYGTGRAASERGTIDSQVAEFKGVAEHLTVLGDGKININTAREEVLKSAFGQGRTQEILLRRKTEGYFSLPSFGGVVTPSFFSIVSSGTVRGFKYTVRALAEKKGNSVKILYLQEQLNQSGI